MNSVKQGIGNPVLGLKNVFLDWSKMLMSRNFWEFDHKHHFLVKHHSPLLGGFCEPPFQSKGWDYK
jgi:hypothetical protein